VHRNISTNQKDVIFKANDKTMFAYSMSSVILCANIRITLCLLVIIRLYLVKERQLVAERQLNGILVFR